LSLDDSQVVLVSGTQPTTRNFGHGSVRFGGALSHALSTR
jgi:hypothetical protein